MEIKALIGYDHVRRIGVGQGMNSEVFLVHDPARGEEVVAKEILRPKLINTVTDLFKEAQAMCSCNAPNIVPIHYACRTATHICLIMPFYRGGSLADKIATDPLTPKEIIQLGQDILIGLERIHTKNYIHFDVKPTNVLFDDRGRAMIADFGQARKVGTGGVVKAPAMYPSAVTPEWLGGAVATKHSDIYQAGLTLYQAANGEQIFKSQRPKTETDLEKQILRGKFPDRDFFLPHIPSLMRTVIRKSLKLKPNERYNTCDQMSQALANVPVKYDWKMITKGHAVTWAASRGNSPTLIVESIFGAGTYSIQIFTDRGGIRRARDKKDWKSGLTREEMHDDLTQLFDRWERE